MNRRPLEPLDAEERALADQLARLGPHGEPSAKLDARILAAAHDAVAAQPPTARRRPRWPLGVGVAASAMLAVAIAWQLRPVNESPDAVSESASAPTAAVADEQKPAPDPGPPVIYFEPAPPPPPPPAAMARVENPPPRDAAATAAAPPVPRKVIAPARQANATASAERAARAAKAAGAREPQAPASVPLRASEAAVSERYDVDYAALPAAPAPSTTLDSVSAAGSYGIVADAETTAAIAARREQARAEHTRSAIAAAEAAEQADMLSRASQTSAAMQEAVPAAPSAGRVATMSGNRMARANAPADGTTRNALKRTDLQLPVAEDTKLEADAWLERIRLRRDLGDRASATDSLLRFKQQHPFQKVPEDLKELLGE